MPTFTPWLWNTQPVLSWNNCYDYARDRIACSQPGGLQPGAVAGHPQVPRAQISVKSIGAAAIADGLVGPNLTMSCGGRHLVALVVDPGFDYHWYRLDTEGFWTHKRGTTEAIAHDDNGIPIADPRDATTVYRDFGGFFCVERITAPQVSLLADIAEIAAARMLSIALAGPVIVSAFRSHSTQLGVDGPAGRGTLIESGGGAMAIVEALVFSGTPNPTRSIGGAPLQDVRERIARSRGVPGRRITAGLGYSGFRVTFAQGELLGQDAAIRELRVFDGTITFLSAGGKRDVRSDSEGIEALLTEIMKDALQGLPARYQPAGLHP